MIKIILTTTLLITLSLGYSLPGTWQLKNINGQQSNSQVVFNIYQSVNTDTKIKYYLQFSQCKHILYSVSISENVMRLDSVQEDNTMSDNAIRQCTQQEKSIENKIAQTLKYVFFFSIKNDLLIFINPSQTQLLQFTRVKKLYLTNVIGKWQLDKLFWQVQGQQVVYFCDGKLQASYETNYVNEIIFTIVKDEQCEEKNLTTALSHAKYYRIKDDELELFDQYSVETVQLFYVKSGKISLKQEEKMVITKQDEQKYTQNGAILVVDYTSNKEQVTSQLQPYLRNQDSKIDTQEIIHTQNK